MEESYGKVDRAEAKARLERIFIHQEPSMIFEGGKNNRERWHNLKYFTWIEQQQRELSELNAQWNDEEYWNSTRSLTGKIDSLIEEFNSEVENL